MKRVLRGFIFIIGLFFIIPNVYAAELKVTSSATTVTPGTKIRITASANGLTGKFSISNSDSNVLSGSTGNDWLENSSGRYEFTAKNLGSSTITISALDVSDSNDGSKWTGSKSITINVVKPREKSNNNNLKDLSVEGYELTPNFSKDTLEYTVNIDKSIEKIKINTKLEDGYASVFGNGEKEVEEGSNKFEIVVTSETGNKKTYTLNVNVKDSNPIIKKIDDKEYTVIKRAKSLELPEVLDKDKFTLSTVKIDEVEVPAYVSEELKLTLVGLKDSNGNSYLFKVEDNKITDKYELLTNSSITILFTTPKDVFDGYSKTNIKINGKEYTAYKNDNTVLIYGTNMSTNESNWYRYDDKENTIQLYDNSLVEVLNQKEKEFNNTLSQYKMIIIGLAVVIVLLLIIIVSLIASKSKLRRRVNRNNIASKKEELVEETKPEVKEEIATKVEETEEAKKEKKNKKEKEVEEEIGKVEEELEKEQNLEETGEIIPNFEEIEEDLKDLSKEEKKEEDELMDPYDFLDIKKKRRK